MLRLISFSLKEPRTVKALYRKAKAAPSNTDRQIALALALARAGCTYEAASILRPLRFGWKASKDAEAAKAALVAQSWWNANWRNFARLKQSGKTAALALLGDRATQYWDLPPLLRHLGGIALERGDLDLAGHLFERVSHLARRGLPKMNMAPFAYVAEAALVDVLCRRGDATAALARHRALAPNPGNAMAHELQHARLLVVAGHLDAALRQTAAILVTAKEYRTGYSRDLRLEFVGTSPDLAPLRRRADWQAMLRDPMAYLHGG